jgi:hypothetical protein
MIQLGNYLIQTSITEHMVPIETRDLEKRFMRFNTVLIEMLHESGDQVTFKVTIRKKKTTVSRLNIHTRLKDIDGKEIEPKPHGTDLDTMISEICRMTGCNQNEAFSLMRTTP